MYAFLRYVALSLWLGLIAVWGSEVFFWSAPQADTDAPALILTVVVYSFCASCALSAVVLSGVSGWKALFLGGTLLGFTVEGVVVSTMYDAFPAQIVWTPLAWHALITSLAIFGLCRAAVHWPMWRHIAALLPIGLFGAVFAQYWPLERGTMPGFWPVVVYVAGSGLLVPLANIAIDPLNGSSAPSRRLLLIAPVLMGLVWLVKLVLWFNPYMLSWPPLILLTCWIMARLGSGTRMPDLGKAVPAWRHFLFMIVPVLSALLSIVGWVKIDGTESNIPVALATGACGFGLYLFLLGKALRRPDARPS